MHSFVLDHVTVTGGTAPLLYDVSGRIGAARRTAVVGRSGAGS